MKRPLISTIVFLSVSLWAVACAKKEEAPARAEEPIAAPAEAPSVVPAEEPAAAPTEQPVAAPAEETVAAPADKYSETADLFRNAGQSASFFGNSYGYAIFPTIGKGGLGIGGAHGNGRVYENGNYVGDTSMTQLSIGFQAGGQGFSQIIFFEDKRAFDEFTSGSFEFGANASAVVITAAASGSAATSGTTGSASGGKKSAATAGKYDKGTAVFMIVKGGLMYEASVSGQKFKYKPLAN